MNRKILFILFIILMGLIGLNTANADVYVNETFENNSVTNWIGAGFAIDSDSPLNGSFSGNSTATTPHRFVGNASVNSNGFNVSFAFRAQYAASWMIFSVQDNAGVINWLIFGNAPCAAAAGHICAFNAGSYVDTGLACNQGNLCNLTIELNSTRGGTADTIFTIHVNGTADDAWYNPVAGDNDVRLLKRFFVANNDGTGNSLLIDDIRIYNATLFVAPPSTPPFSWQIDGNLSNATDYETFTGVFLLNTSFNSSNVTDINARLNYSGTIYTPTKRTSAGANSTANFSSSITFDLINNDFTNYTHRWEINITWANATIEQVNNTAQNQTRRWAYILNASSFVSNRTDWETFFTHLRFDFFNNSNAATLTGSRIGYNGTNLTTSINTTTIYSNATIGLEDNNNSIRNVQVNLSVVFNSIAINRTFNVSQRINWGYWITNFTLGDGINQTVEDSNISIRFYFNNISSPVNLTPRIRWDNTTYLANLNPITNFAVINISLPFINATNVTIDVFGNLTINFSGREISRTSLTDQFVYRMILTDCTGGLTSTEALNFTFRDEDTEQLRVTELDINFDLTKSGSNTKNLSFTRTGADSYKFCLYPKWFEFNVDAITDYQASTFSSYATRSYFLNNVNVSNTTSYIRPYHINTSVSSNIQLTVTDTNDIPIAGMYVKALRYYPESNTFRTVEIGRTGTNGETILKLQLNNVWYKFLFVDDNEVTRLESTTTKITSTTLFYTINLLSQFLSTFNDVRNIEHSLTYNNATGVVRFTFNDPTGIVREGCLEVTQRDSYGDRRICRSCTASTAATILCTVGTNLSGTYILRGYIDTNTANSQYIIDYIELFLDTAWQTFGQTGYGLFMAAIFITAVMMLGIWNLGVSIGLGIVGTFIMGYLNIISLPGSFLILLIIIGMALLMKSRT